MVPGDYSASFDAPLPSVTGSNAKPVVSAGNGTMSGNVAVVNNGRTNGPGGNSTGAPATTATARSGASGVFGGFFGMAVISVLLV